MLPPCFKYPFFIFKHPLLQLPLLEIPPTFKYPLHTHFKDSLRVLYINHHFCCFLSLISVFYYYLLGSGWVSDGHVTGWQDFVYFGIHLKLPGPSTSKYLIIVKKVLIINNNYYNNIYLHVCLSHGNNNNNYNNKPK